MTHEPLVPPVNHKNPRHEHIPGTPTLKAEHLVVTFEGVRVLDDVSFELVPGERLAVVGPNGAGKSTLFRVISGVLKADSGSVHVFGADPLGHICIAYLPQRSQVDWTFPVTVADVVLMGRTGKLGLLHWPTRNDQKFVEQALESVNLSGFSNRQISQLSGGQQQRMFIARALAQEAELLLLDEPFTGLDAPTRDDLFAALDLLRTKKVTVMLALHDMKLAADHFDRLMMLNHQLVALGLPGEVISEENLKRAYGNRIQVLVHDHEVAVIDDTCCGEEGHDHD